MVASSKCFEFAKYRIDKLCRKQEFMKYLRVQFHAVTNNCYSEHSPACKSVPKQEKFLIQFMLRYLKTHIPYCVTFMGYVNHTWSLRSADNKFLESLQQKEMVKFVMSKVGAGPFFSDTVLTCSEAVRIMHRIAHNRDDEEMIKQDLEATFRGELFNVNLLNRIDFTLEQTLMVWETQLKHMFDNIRRPVQQKHTPEEKKYCFKKVANNFKPVVTPIEIEDDLVSDESLYLKDIESEDEEMFHMELDEEEKMPDAPKVFDATKGPVSPFLAECPNCKKIVTLPWGQHVGTYMCAGCSALFTASYGNLIV